MLTYKIVTERFLTQDVIVPFAATKKLKTWTRNIKAILINVMFQDKTNKYAVIEYTYTDKITDKIEGDNSKDKLIDLVFRGKRVFSFDNAIGVIVTGINGMKIPVIYSTIDDEIKFIVPRMQLIDIKTALGIPEIVYLGDLEAVGEFGYKYNFKESK